MERLKPLVVGPSLSVGEGLSSAKPVIAPEGSYILEPPEPPEALEQLAFLWSTPEALEQLTFLQSPLEG